MAKFEIIVGSVLGASEYVADALAETLTKHGHSANIHLSPDFAEINNNAIWLICTSTHGAGDLPDNIQTFAQQLSQHDLSKLKFLVVGLGDSSYDTFCYAAQHMENILTNAKATLLYPAIHIDVLNHPIPEDVAVEWLNNLLQSIQLSDE
ncbi:FMN-binding protein MioC [Paraglaciecola hydrolytica]|uniref:Nitric oxide synthase n=1 Tax=Paraglaciecola hydrolytica TaxID=1799789 RepID=A0A136A480_9ALTE|nr:FMN-binding protein MioC [Paraglaciecola hydrolytica]KXI30031.1 nitric oxide synthase [Paraglaciecola hydrolytica]